MTVEQLYYTSCARGLGASAGFQVNAASDGFERTAFADVQGFVGYEPPASAPAMPTPAELARFPVALSYGALPNGAMLLGRTAYVGTDYSGRHGNFFAHVLHLSDPGRDLDPHRPIDLWESPLWVDRESPSPVLEPVGGPIPATPMSPAALVEFLDTDVRRRRRLTTFLAAVHQNLDPAARRQIVLVEDSSADIARWIAIAGHSLPRHLANRLTFTTYTRRPYYASQRIIGTTPDGEFGYSVHELNDQYVVLDFPGDRFSPELEAPWAELVARLWRADTVDLLSDVHRFEMDAGGQVTPAHLAGLLAAFGAARGRRLSERTAGLALDWVQRNRQLDNPSFWRAFGQGVAGSPDVLSYDTLSRLAREWHDHRPGAEAEALVEAYVARTLDQLVDGTPAGGVWAPADHVVDEAMLELLALSRTSVATLVDLVEWLDRTATPSPKPWLIELGEARIGDAVLRDSSQVAGVLALTRLRSGRWIGEGLLSRLDVELTHGREGFSRVLGLARTPLAELLASPGAAPVLGLVVDVARAPTDSSLDRVRLLHELSGHTADGDLRWCYRLIWGDARLNATEASEILDTFAPPALLEGGFVAQLVATVLDAPVITRRVVSLAERLVDLAEQARTSRDELGVLRAVADFSLIPGADTRISAQVLTDVTYLGDAASGVDCPAREQLLGFIVSWVIALAPADQATALAAVLDSGSRPLRRAYARAAEELPDPGDAAWPRAVADRFSAWVTLGETHPEASSELLDRVLKPALQRPRRGERAALERELKARGRDVWSAWERWSDGRGRRRHR